MVRNQIAALQVKAGAEALKSLSEDREREISGFAREAAQLQCLLDKLEEFNDPNALLGTYAFVTPEF